MHRRGFTFVELLVVLGFMALLVAILFPVFAVCRCERPTCRGNLGQLGKAVMMYAADYEGKYPPAGLTCLDPAMPDGSPGCRSGALLLERGDGGDQAPDAVRYGYGETWQGGGLVALQPYLKQWRYAWCAKKEGRRPLPTDPRSYYAGFEWLRSPARIRYPSQKVLMLEAYSNHGEGPPLRFDDVSPGHRQHLVAYVDGHVQWRDLSTGCSGSPTPECKGWESCMGPGGNGNYICSGFGKGVNVPDFPSTARAMTP